jgi:hypothetical protein
MTWPMWNASWRRAGDETNVQGLTRRRLDLLFGLFAGLPYVIPRHLLQCISPHMAVQ